MDSNKNLIFLHLPKNGGTTTNAILKRIYPKKNTFEIKVIDKVHLNTQEFIDLSLEERKEIHLLQGHMKFGLHEHMVGPSEYITFLRKPEDRIISFYYYVLASPGHRLHKKIKEENMSFYEFVTTIDQRDVNNAQVRYISGIFEDENTMLEKALENIDKYFSFVGLTERFDESLILLKHIYKLNTPYYRSLNKTSKRITSKELDQKTKDAIAELNRGDVLLYEAMEKKFNSELENITSLKSDLFKLKIYNKLYSSYKKFRK